jgi:hypothetical protein
MFATSRFWVIASTQTDVSGIDNEIGAPTMMLLIEAARRADELESGHAP